MSNAFNSISIKEFIKQKSSCCLLFHYKKFRHNFGAVKAKIFSIQILKCKYLEKVLSLIL